MIVHYDGLIRDKDKRTRGDRKAIRTRLNFLYALESISVCFSVNMMSVNYFSSESFTLFFFKDLVGFA